MQNMSKLRIITTSEAKADIKNLTSYIAKENKQAAISVAKIIRKTIVMLSEYPLSGSKKEDIVDKEIFIYTIKKRFLLVYKIIDDKIVFLRVLTRYQDIFAIL